MLEEALGIGVELAIVELLLAIGVELAETIAVEVALEVFGLATTGEDVG